MQTNTSLDLTEFRQIIDQLCLSASADFSAARSRLESLHRDGPDVDDG